MCVCVCYSPLPRFSLLQLLVCALGFWFRLSTRISKLGVLQCVCFCAHFSPTPQVLADLRDVGVSARIFTFTPPILAGLLGCLCLCAHSAYTPPVLARVCSVGECAWVRVSVAPHHCWLGCWGVYVCVRFAHTPPIIAELCGVGVLDRVSAFTPPIQAGVLGCVFFCTRSAYTAPFVAEVCHVSVRAGIGVSAAPLHS